MPTIIEAKQVIQSAPRGLPALCFLQRRPLGTSVRVCAMGDIGFHGKARTVGDRNGYEWMFNTLNPVLRTAQVVFGNLESSLTDKPPRPGCFGGPRLAADGLTQAGFTLLHLANNHAYDFGAEGCASTMLALEKAGLGILGAGSTPEAARRLVRTDASGIRIGWLGCGRTLRSQTLGGANYWEFNEESLITGIRQSKAEVDFLVVSVHAGYEYIEIPSPERKATAERCLSEGAKLVLMHHSHVLEGVQAREGKGVVCYGLGNLLFDSAGGVVQIDTMLEERSRSAVFVFDIDAQGICFAGALPVFVNEEFRLEWALGSKGKQALEHLAILSQLLEGNSSAAFEQQRAERNVGPVFAVLWYALSHREWAILTDMVRRIRLRNALMLIRWLWHHSFNQLTTYLPFSKRTKGREA